MKTQTKVLIGVIVIAIWVSFINWADTTLPAKEPTASNQKSQSIDVCKTLRSEKDLLENDATALARQALDLQSRMLRARLNEIVISQKLSKSKSDILIEYLSYDMMKLIEEKSDVFGDSFKRHVDLRPSVIKIVDELLERNILQPQYFEEVQLMGNDLRQKYAVARNIVASNKDCFKFTAEVDEMIDEITEKVNNGKTYNGWTAAHTAEELVDSMR
jgi:hypothetical protein